MTGMVRDYDVIVIGAGGAGSSSALELARRGKRVLLLERFQVGHDRGSSHGHSRIFRFAYDEADYARLAVAALKAWRQLEADSGERLLTPTGGLDLGPEGNESLERTATGMTAAGASFERLSARELMERFPQWRVPENWSALYSGDAGIVAPTHTVEVMAALARAAGAELLEMTAVTGINLEELSVETGRGRFAADQIVIAAGAWLTDLLPDLMLPLTVTLESSAYFAPHDLDLFKPDRFPLFINHESLEYGFPAFGLPGVKLGAHQSGPVTSAETRGYEVPPETLSNLHGFLERFLPGQSWRLIAAKTCLYTNTPSHDFLLDTHPESDRVLIVSPCSGHGFKFAPLIGSLVADRLEGRQNPFHFPRFQLANALRAGEAKLLARTTRLQAARAPAQVD
jgi:sarcosine oxidase